MKKRIGWIAAIIAVFVIFFAAGWGIGHMLHTRPTGGEVSATKSDTSEVISEDASEDVSEDASEVTTETSEEVTDEVSTEASDEESEGGDSSAELSGEISTGVLSVDPESSIPEDIGVAPDEWEKYLQGGNE